MTFTRRVKPIVLAALWAVFTFSTAQAAYLSKVNGLVQVKTGAVDRWDVVKSIPLDLVAGDSVRTALKAQATLIFEDGSRVELGPNSSFTLEEASKGRSALKLGFGSLKAFVQKLGSRRFQVRTPTAVCSVRGTEFGVQVMSGGRTVVDLYKGLLGVEDRRGQQVLLHPNERVQVDLRGMGSPTGLPTQGALQKSQFHALMQKEMVLDLSKEQVMAAAVNEIKSAEFQQGKSIIDVFGKRVRIEEYIVRPADNQFKLVALNSRQDRFDYFYYLGTFNTNLPNDLSVALRQINGTIGTAPTYWLTGFETGRSNTKDSIVEKGIGGHPVDVNNNADATDNVNSFFDTATNKIIDTTGLSVYKTLFDNYGLYVNGNLKYGWTGSNLQQMSDKVTASNNDPITGALLATAMPTDSGATSTYPEGNRMHEVIYDTFVDGTFLQFDNYIISDQGKIASTNDFATSGATYKDRLLHFNYEQVVTASEFQGRKIDLVVEPKIFIQSGLIP